MIRGHAATIRLKRVHDNRGRAEGRFATIRRGFAQAWARAFEASSVERQTEAVVRRHLQRVAEDGDAMVVNALVEEIAAGGMR